MNERIRRNPTDMMHLEQVVLDRLAREPASFQDLVDEGILDRGTAATMQTRLNGKGLLRPFGKRQARRRGKPRTIYALRV